MNALRLYILTCCCLVISIASAYAQNQEWQLLHQGNKAFKNGQYETAKSFYDKVLKINPSNPRAIYNMGNVQLAQGNDSAALSLYDKARSSEHNNQVRAMANHNKGYIYQRQAGAATDAQAKQNSLKAAIDSYKQALREDPEMPSTRYNLALCQKQLKESKDQNQQQQQQQKDKQQQQQQDQKKKNDPLMNYARQAEKQTRQKINSSAGQKSLEKNW